jgi:hypothetical protein
MSDDVEHRSAEQRRRKRADLGSEILVRIGDSVWSAQCVNVSMSGALLAVFPRQADERGRLAGRSGCLRIEHRFGGEKLAVEAEFTVVRADRGAFFPRSFLLGVKFVDMDPESSIRLFQVLRWQAKE